MLACNKHSEFQDKQRSRYKNKMWVMRGLQTEVVFEGPVAPTEKRLQPDWTRLEKTGNLVAVVATGRLSQLQSETFLSVLHCHFGRDVIYTWNRVTLKQPHVQLAATLSLYHRIYLTNCYSYDVLTLMLFLCPSWVDNAYQSSCIIDVSCVSDWYIVHLL
jgi:hypothetical protein